MLSGGAAGPEPAGFARARAVADAVLFEGYVLYPYRASAPKNRLRWQFGVLAPQGSDPSETSYTESDSLVEVRPGAAASLTVRLRFLQVRRRYARAPGELPWDEGVVQEVQVSVDLVPGARVTHPFQVPGGEDDGRRRWPLSGELRITAEPEPGPYGLLRVRVRTENRTAGGSPDRTEMLCGALIGTHTLLAVTGGRFLSPVDPPEWASGAVSRCENAYTWPSLIDDTTLLCAPVILGDRPRIAPESPADFHDGTEIDELLTLRTMTLTEDEKREARATDPRAAAIVDHAERVTPDVLERLHGVVRPSPPAEAADRVPVTGGWAEPGSRVRLRPGGRRADAQDMFLAGRTARVAVVLRDVDGSTQLAVTLDDDPGADLRAAVGRYHYFAPDEVELLCT
ncbi:hypothetical protein [Streptomyces violens]|uniref:hypothetical protein n=1 Tax=Streptomyces violens TaxID=66377 RepID=UPI000B061749|nr:hypothetical protein [Streptomyces violens]